ncbi:hypothetical protein QC761_401395 [Podospora bellae-mahoneyi]|uniref:Heterokaryon incompatibility domain-containing protein n=1 Tax=Podospora bellae-mahoneyi TaxID=2093777 RepID=A0ABR0FFY7_9PEZI|nr:hypothetical protein QC761_401395 [Podospora bellae-mahoneyi]
MKKENKVCFSICEAMDDFNGDVFKGPLSQRGWVLQEHALARRTILFAEKQTYWECGEGVMCQTNSRCFLMIQLSQPNLQRLAGRENTPVSKAAYRILSALKAKSGFGVFDEGPEKKGLLRRSLLWIRGRDTEKMARIKFGVEQAISFVPSWSVHQSAFGEIHWYELTSLWFGGAQSLSPASDGRGAHSQGLLLAKARDYDVSNAGDGERRIEMDSPGGSEQKETKCVVLGQRGP